jgi:hypothetical protein
MNVQYVCCSCSHTQPIRYVKPLEHKYEINKNTQYRRREWIGQKTELYELGRIVFGTSVYEDFESIRLVQCKTDLTALQSAHVQRDVSEYLIRCGSVTTVCQ